MRALILSAGLGERLRPHTLNRAKPALEFLNMPMLSFPYFWLDTLGLNEVTFNTHYLPETVRNAALQVVRPETKVHFSHEDAILGSGGGIWNARFHLQSDHDFAVANGDGVVTFSDPSTLLEMLTEHRRRGSLATLLVCPLEGVGTRTPGVWFDRSSHEVLGFGKSAPRAGLSCRHYASYMFVSARLWSRIPEGPSNILYDVFMDAIAAGEHVHVYEVSAMKWFETGNVADYLAATRSCLEHLRDGTREGRGLREMLERFAPHFEGQSDFAQLRLIDDSAEISPGTLHGFSVIGAGAQVQPGASVENSVILPHTVVGPAVQARGLII